MSTEESTEIEQLQQALSQAMKAASPHTDDADVEITPKEISIPALERTYEQQDPRLFDLGEFASGFSYEGMKGRGFAGLLFNILVLPVWWFMNAFLTLFHELAHALVGFVGGIAFAGVIDLLREGVQYGLRAVFAIPFALITSRFLWAARLIPKVRIYYRTDAMTHYVPLGGIIVSGLVGIAGYLGPVIFGTIFLVWALTGDETSVLVSQVLFWVMLVTGVLGAIFSLVDAIREHDFFAFGWVQIPLSLVWGWAVYNLPTADGDNSAWLWFLGISGAVLILLGARDAFAVYWAEFSRSGLYETNDFALLEEAHPYVPSVVWAAISFVLFIAILAVGGMIIYAAYTGVLVGQV